MAVGAANKYLNENATTTFWRSTYEKHTNFAMESIRQEFNSLSRAGADCQAQIQRNGDLIYWMYAVIDLPGIQAIDTSSLTGGNCLTNCNSNFPFAASTCDPCGDGLQPPCACCSDPQNPPNLTPQCLDFGAGTKWAHYINAIGQFVIRRACVVIGGTVCSSLYSNFMFAWEELSGKPGARLTEMIGKRYTRDMLIADSARDRTLYVPLPFPFTTAPGNAFPLVALHFHGVQVHVAFEELKNLVQVSDGEVCVVKCGTCTPLTDTDISCHLETTYVHLEPAERDMFAASGFQQLIWQVQEFEICTSACDIRASLNFNLPVIELIWMVRRQCQEEVNNYSNFSGKYGLDPIDHVDLYFNNQSRFTHQPASYFRLVQPYQHHTNIPDGYIYCYSFALYPEDPTPSGAVNFSRLDSIVLNVHLQKDLFSGDSSVSKEVKFFCYARNWNILRFRGGLAGVAFQS